MEICCIKRFSSVCSYANIVKMSKVSIALVVRRVLNLKTPCVQSIYHTSYSDVYERQEVSLSASTLMIV